MNRNSESDEDKEVIYEDEDIESEVCETLEELDDNSFFPAKTNVTEDFFAALCVLYLYLTSTIICASLPHVLIPRITCLVIDWE